MKRGCCVCFVAHQAPGVQALEAQALQLTTNPEAETHPAAQHASPFAKSSTWTGLVDLDNTRVNSLAKTNNSSEISEEHVIIHLQPVEDWEEHQDGPGSSQPIGEESDESEGTKSGNVSGLANLRSVENHGGSAHEQDDGGSFSSSDIPALSTVASSTPQPHSSNSVLAEFVKSLMRPFRYLTGAEKSEKTQKARENNTQEETSSRNLSFPKGDRKKGSVDNAIVEHKSDSLSFWTAGVLSPNEGLSEREKEAGPLIQLVPAIPKAGQSDTETQPVEGASSPPSTVDGMKSCLCGCFFFLLLVFPFKTTIWVWNESRNEDELKMFFFERGVGRWNVTGKYRICLSHAF